MKRIKAAITEGRGKPFVIEDVELDDYKEDEILVEIKAVGICHTDEAAQMQILPVPLPAVLGHEGAGIVRETGAAVSEFAPGDHVVLSFASCGACDPCLQGKPYACENMVPLNFQGVMQDGSRRHWYKGKQLSNFFSQSSFAAMCAVKARNAVKIDKSIDLGVAAPFGCGIQTGAGIVLNSLDPPFGSTLAVSGCGTVGMCAIMAAAIRGCKEIIAIGGNEKSLALAEELGATRTINRKKTEDIPAAIRGYAGAGLDYFIDTSGVETMINNGMESLNYMGTLVMAGAGSTLHLGLNLGAKTIKGVTEGNSIPKHFIPALLDYYQRGLFPVDKLIKFWRFDEINEAFAASHSGEAIKAVLRMD